MMKRPLLRFHRIAHAVSLKHLGRRGIAIGAAIVIVAGLGGVAAAVTVGPGTLGGFEIDGNFVPDVAGNKDWTNIASKTVVTDDTADSGFTQGSKELKPSGWACGTGGATPNKGNILRAYVSPAIGTGGEFLNLGFVAENINGGGDVHLNFEFNQTGTASPATFVPGPCPISRVAGDLLVTFDYPGGGGKPTINAFRWLPAVTPDASHDGDWIDQNLSSAAANAAVNTEAVIDPFVGGSINAERFGEATIDLSAVYGQEPTASCNRNGFVNVRSRSSGESITSALQDKLPSTGFDLSTCGSIVVHKVDDHVPPHALAGATFGLFKNAAATGASVDTCPSLADGTCTFSNINPGAYWVKELSAPSGYAPDPGIVAVDVGIKQNVDVQTPFVDPRDVGSVRIIKQLRDEHGDLVAPSDLSTLNGAAFVLYRDANSNNNYDVGEAIKLWPQETTTAACTITNSLGYCDIPSSGYSVPTGTYRVHETAAPADTGTGDDVGPVVIVKNAQVSVNYTNTLSPLHITIDKSGKSNDTVAGATNAHVGDTIHYTLAVSTTGPKLHDVTVAEVGTNRCDAAISGPVKTGGNQDANLEIGEVWTYNCDHVVTVNDPDPLPNEAKVTGTDTFGRHTTDSDTYSLDILHPAITVDKTVEGADHKPIADALVTRSGTLVHYVVTIHNSGDAALSLTTLTDSLEGALSGAVCTPSPAAGLAVGATITCSYTASPTDDAHNVASVTGVDVLGGERGTKTASDETFVDVIHPSVAIVKTATSTLQPGVGNVTVAHESDPIIYHFAVHNTGDVTLTNISVDDVPLGHIGTIDSLAPDATTTLTLNMPAPASDLTNTGTACGNPGVGTDVCGNDGHTLHIIHPAITVEKTATSTTQPGVLDVTQAHAGDPMIYHFKVHNTGDVALTNVTVNDSVFGAIPGSIATLAVGATDSSLSKAVDAPATDLFNTATACGLDPLQTEKCATDNHLLDILKPGLHVTKSANVSSAHVGDTVTYSFAVHNTGNVTLTNVSVNDNVFGHIDTIASLAAGQTQTLTKTVVITAGMLDEAGNAVDNNVTACGNDPVQVPKCDTDFHHLPVLHPALTIDKKVEGADHKPLSDALLAHAGDTLGYSVVIHNTGDTPLTITSLSDTLKSGLSGTCGVGIGGSLLAGASTTCTYAMTAADDAHNVVSVTGVDAAGGTNGTKSATDETFVNVIHPAISLDKKVDNADHKPASDALLAHQGDSLNYTVVIHNTGDTPLRISALSDTLRDGLAATCGKGIDDTLAPEESTTCTYNTTAGTNDAHNVASVTAVDAAGGPASATDETFVDVIHPAITVTKVADPKTVEPGQTTTYTYVVTNTGDTALSNVAVTDDVLGAIGTVGSLAPGESKTLTKTMTIHADSPRTNIATACGVDVLSLKVCSKAKATISIVLPVTPQQRIRTPAPRVTVTPPRSLPHTGFRLFLWVAIATALTAAGMAMMQAQRRSRRV